MKTIIAAAVLALLTGCGAGVNEPQSTMPASGGTQWCTVATNTGNACPAKP